jgi:hypothetical protein
VVAGLVLLHAIQLADLRAQSIWLEPHGDRNLYLEYLNPRFPEAEDDLLTSSIFLSARYRVGDKVVLVGELPFSTVKDSDNAVGNPYVGVEFGESDGRGFAELGVRLPFSPEDNVAAIVGALTDYVDRFEAFIPDAFAVVGAGNYRYKSAGGFSLRLRGAPLLLVPTGDGGDTELFLLYSVQAWYEGPTIATGGGFNGRAIITQGDLDLGERTVNQLTLMVNLSFGRWQPGAQLRLPLDDELTDFVDMVLSLSLGFHFD